MYYSLISRGLFSNKQKGCRKGSKGTTELLYIDQHNLNESKKRRKNLAMELTAGGKGLVETKIQRGVFPGDALSPLLFIIAMMPLNHILNKCTAGYKLGRSQEKVNHLMYMDGIKLFAKNEKELETLIHTEYTVKT